MRKYILLFALAVATVTANAQQIENKIEAEKANTIPLVNTTPKDMQEDLQ